MRDYFVPFEAGACFHVFTHGVGEELVFREPQNYVFFLGKYKKYISPIADTFAYSLLPSHFHICIRFKSEADILNSPKALARGSPLLREGIPKFLMQQFSNFLNSYALKEEVWELFGGRKMFLKYHEL